MPSLFSAATLNIITTVGIIAAGLGYLVQQFVSGRRKRDQDLITDLTERLQSQKEMIDSFKDELEALKQEVAHLKEINVAYEQRLKDYATILANRNPDLDKTLLNISAVVAEVVPFMQEMKESHQYLRDTLNSLASKRRPKEKHDAA